MFWKRSEKSFCFLNVLLSERSAGANKTKKNKQNETRRTTYDHYERVLRYGRRVTRTKLIGLPFSGRKFYPSDENVLFIFIYFLFFFYYPPSLLSVARKLTKLKRVVEFSLIKPSPLRTRLYNVKVLALQPL